MSNIEIVKYDKELLKSFKYNGVEQEFSGEEITPIVDFYAGLGTCYVGIIEGRILGVGGVYPLWEKAGGCFLFVNKEIQNYKKSVFKILLSYMSELIEKYKIKTLIVECNDDSLQAKNLINHLGFIKSKETKMSVFIKGA